MLENNDTDFGTTSSYHLIYNLILINHLILLHYMKHYIRATCGLGTLLLYYFTFLLLNTSTK